MRMIRGKHIVALGAAFMVLAHWIVRPQTRALAGGQATTVTANTAPSPEQIRSLVQRAIDNQHRDDRALEEFERTEHRVARKGENAEILTDITERLVPTGSGTVKLKLAENGTAVQPEEFREELEFAVHALDLAVHPNERYREDLAKYERRRREHDELVDTAEKAFRVTWTGRETRADPRVPHGSRTFVKLLLDPDPDYKPINRFAASFQHVHATLWVDEEASQFARLEGDIDTDIPFGGGIAGKVYRGGHVVMVQEEEAPGIWLPTLFTYDVDGRKFVLPFGIHERTEITGYRRVGPPPQAIEIMRNELNNQTAASPAR
jgi:hypothetical protein